MSEGYFLAGYLVATRAPRHDLPDGGPPGAELVSISDCVVDLAPAEPWDPFFADLSKAEQALVRPESHLLAVGIAAIDVPALVADMGEFGGSMAERLNRREPMPDAHVLGFELIGFDTGSAHTWMCLGGLVEDVRQATGVQPGEWGLVQDEPDARLAAQWLTASNLGDPKVFLWISAMVVQVAGFF